MSVNDAAAVPESPSGAEASLADTTAGSGTGATNGTSPRPLPVEVAMLPFESTTCTR